MKKYGKLSRLFLTATWAIAVAIATMPAIPDSADARGRGGGAAAA